VSNEELVRWWKEQDAADEPALGSAEPAHPAGSISLAALTGAGYGGYHGIPRSWVDACPTWFGPRCDTTAVIGL
jgi:hypothetical protein